MSVEADSNEPEITNEGPQSYLERAVAAAEEAAASEAESEAVPKAEPGLVKEDPEPAAEEPEAKTAQGAAAGEIDTESGEPADPISALEQKLRARQQAREQREQEQQEPSEVAQLREQVTALQEQLNARKTDEEHERLVKLAKAGRWQELAEAAGHDPLNAYDTWTRQAAEGAREAPAREVEEIRKELEALRRERQEEAQRKEEEAQQRAREQEQRHAAEAHRSAVQGWLDYADASGDKFPRLASVSAADRHREGVYYAQRLAEAEGPDAVNYERVAQLVEAHYKRLGVQPRTNSGANGTGKPAGRGDPSTITNEIAAQSAGTDESPRGRLDYFNDALSAIERSKQSA